MIRICMYVYMDYSKIFQLQNIVTFEHGIFRKQTDSIDYKFKLDVKCAPVFIKLRYIQLYSDLEVRVHVYDAVVYFKGGGVGLIAKMEIRFIKKIHVSVT